MWKETSRGLKQVKDETRKDLRIRLKREVLDDLKMIAKEHDTNVSFLIENGLENMFQLQDVHFEKITRARGNVPFLLFIDEALVEKIRTVAEERDLKISNVVSASLEHIDLETVKTNSWKHRVQID